MLWFRLVLLLYSVLSFLNENDLKEDDTILLPLNLKDQELRRTILYLKFLSHIVFITY